MRRFIILFCLAWLQGVSAFAADCPLLAETGEPAFAGGDVPTTAVCHTNYAALHDDGLLVSRWVAYRLTTARTLGCLKPGEDFYAEPMLPAGKRAEPEDYRRSGYDRGHLAPAEDFAWDADALRDSFSMANAVPQLPGLNREGWRRLEEMVPSWACSRGDLTVFTGPILAPDRGTIGAGRIAVPAAFFKVVLDPRSRQAIAFVLPQRYVGKSGLDRWITSIADIEARTGLSFPLPADTDRTAKASLWPADIPAWRLAAHLACTRHDSP